MKRGWDFAVIVFLFVVVFSGARQVKLGDPISEMGKP